MKRTSVSLLVAAALVAVASNTAAQTRSDGFALNRFDPSERGSEWFALDSLDLRGDPRPVVGLVGEWAYKPLVIYNADGDEVTAPVKHQFYLHLGAGINLFDRWRISISVPMAVHTSGDAGIVGGTLYKTEEGFSFGDLRLATAVRLFGEYGESVNTAVGIQVFLPTGDRASYTGDGGVRIAPHANIAGDIGAFVYAAELGAVFHTQTDNFAGQAYGGDLTLGAALGARLLDRHLLLGPEFSMSTVLSDSAAGAFGSLTTPAEVLMGAHYTLDNGLRFGLGAGPGLSRGFGSPLVRVLGNVEWSPPYADKEVDSDGDGIINADDACPDVAGGKTDDPATHGCPDSDGDTIIDKSDACPQDAGIATDSMDTHGCPDGDGDGIVDLVDACPQTPGIASSDASKHGCPDSDGDGIIDKHDACPQIKGLPNSDKSKHGCPPPDDNDGDGVVNDDDACPNKPGPKRADPAINGCPDSDGDGIVDKQDACPNKPGVADVSHPRKHGCPKATIQGSEIKIIDRVEFDTDRATIRSTSEPVLNAVLTILKKHPEITKVSVEGHTDNRGGAAHNKQLSRRRAAAVVTWLVARGIDSARLVSAGFGPDRPIDTNSTTEGRQNNRRVEFHILENKGGTVVRNR